MGRKKGRQAIGIKKVLILMLIFILSIFVISCKKEEALKKPQAEKVEEEMPYDKIEDMSEESFDIMLSKVRDQIMVFDIAEVHDKLYPVIEKTVDSKSSDEEIEKHIELIIVPFMDEWTSNRIRDYLISEIGEVSENDIEAFKDKIDNSSLIDFIIVYEKNFLKGK